MENERNVASFQFYEEGIEMVIWNGMSTRLLIRGQVRRWGIIKAKNNSATTQQDKGTGAHKVANIMTADRTWDRDKMVNLFKRDSARRIMGTHISITHTEDKLHWLGTSFGNIQQNRETGG